MNLPQRLQARMTECFDRADMVFGRAFQRPKLVFDLFGTNAGQARYTKMELGINAILAAQHPEQALFDTMPHEVAHFVCFELMPGAPPHGDAWRVICIALGLASPSVCHTLDTVHTVHRTKRYPYACNCGKHSFSPQRHAQLKKRPLRYICKLCKSHFKPLGKQNAQHNV